HPYLADEIARAGAGQNELLAVSQFKDFQLATQNDDQPEVSLTCPENELAAPHDAPGAERLEHSKLSVVQQRKGDTLRIAVELFILLEFRHIGKPACNQV